MSEHADNSPIDGSKAIRAEAGTLQVTSASVRTILPLSIVTCTSMLAMRLLQGVGAGVATVVAPSVVRATLSENDAVRGFASISMVESIVPAAGPVLGAALLLHMDWRGLFWILSALTLAVLPFVIRIAFLAGALIVDLSFVAVAAFWCVFCGALAIRGPGLAPASESASALTGDT